MKLNDDLKQLIEDRVLRVNAMTLGLVAGTLGGATLFMATNWLVLKGGADVGSHLRLLGQYFYGYRVTFWGSVIGAVYAFGSCFITAYLGARLYNRVVSLRHGPESRE